VRKRLALVSLAVTFLALPVAAEVLFPTPLHLTRRIHDSIGNTTTVVDQYCYANRVVTVRGHLTSIADYERGELTEINRDDSTYSVTRFDEVAKALGAAGPPSAAPAKSAWKVRSSGVQQVRTNRSADVFEGELEEEGVTRRTRVAVDRSVSLSKDALDILIGAAYPSSRKAEDQVVVEATRTRTNVSTNQSEGTAQSRSYALPVEQHSTYVIEGMEAEVRDTVTRVGAELVPPDLLSIPPGAKLVESRLLQRMHAVEMLDTVARTPAPRP